MEPLEQLRAKIANFPGYDGDMALRRSDEYVRAYLGEALSELAARHIMPPEFVQRLDDLVLRLEFADPRLFGSRHDVVATKSSDGGAVAAADVATLALADRAASLEAASAGSYLDEITTILDERDAAIRAAASATP
jgi:hypothetical protein